jgi:hypothetical protein
MAKAVSILSPFHNLPIADVVDQLGSIKAQIADLETREKALREELLRRAVPNAAGTLYDAAISSTVRWTLDMKAVKAEQGADWYDAHCRQSMLTTVAVKPRAVVAQAIAA